jgi:sterol desaturase/sphingolipid hydroxylase (fatty acid hydroxylase superfamily)
MGPLHKAHLTHHLELYPPGDFSSEKYRNAGAKSTTWIFLVAGLPLLLGPLAFAWWGIIDWLTGICLIVVTGGIGLLHDRIHDWMHLSSHWFHWVPGAKRLIEMHKVHHSDMTKNFGIFTFFWDKLAKTFEGVK